MSRFWLSLSPASSRNPSALTRNLSLFAQVPPSPAGVIEQLAPVLELVNQAQQTQPESFHISLPPAVVRLVEAAFQGFERGHPFARECLHSMTCLWLCCCLLSCCLDVALMCSLMRFLWSYCVPFVA